MIKIMYGLFAVVAITFLLIVMNTPALLPVAYLLIIVVVTIFAAQDRAINNDLSKNYQSSDTNNYYDSSEVNIQENYYGDTYSVVVNSGLSEAFVEKLLESERNNSERLLSYATRNSELEYKVRLYETHPDIAKLANSLDVNRLNLLNIAVVNPQYAVITRDDRFLLTDGKKYAPIDRRELDYFNQVRELTDGNDK